MLREKQLLQNKYRHLSKKHTTINEEVIKLETENLILGNELFQYIESINTIINNSKGTQQDELKKLLLHMKQNSDWNNSTPFEHINTKYIVEDIITNLKRGNNKPACQFELLNLPVIEARWEDFKVLMVNLIHDAIKRTELSKEGKITFDCIEEIDEYKFIVIDNRVINQESRGLVCPETEQVDGIYLQPENTLVCKRIVKNYNGNLWFSSEQETGYTVYFTIAKQGIIEINKNVVV